MKAFALFLCLSLLLGSVVVLAEGPNVGAPHADGVFVPPSSKAAQQAADNPLPVKDLEAYLAHVSACHPFGLFEGRNELLKNKSRSAKGGPLRGGEVVAVDMAAEELFGPPLIEGNARVYAASIVSIDAEAVRLRVDLSSLESGAEVWVVDPELPRAFGPYSANDHDDGGRWLATIRGEEAVLMARVPGPELPAIRLTEYSHIFLSFEEIAKELSCNIDLACETDETILDISSGVGMIIVGGSWFCTGTLINNPHTEDLEPFFVTANHCVCSRDEARATEVIWDYRSTACDAGDAPGIDTLPRSMGDALLATNAALDATLIRLSSVREGDYGRAYAGWDARLPDVGENTFAIHHPEATHMRISKGHVTGVNEDEAGHEHQTKVLWDEGVTENGSSGSSLLFTDSYRIAGMLSQGPTHTCGPDRSGNRDWFASFHHFYPMVKDYVDTSTPSTAEGGDDCWQRVDIPLCPFVVTFGEIPIVLARFRTIRHEVFEKYAAGRKFLAAYDDVAPDIAKAVSRSAVARGTFMAFTAPLANVGAILQQTS